MRSRDDPVYAEQVRSSYGHLPLTLSVNVWNSVLLGLILAPTVSRVRILTWTGLMVGLSIIRLALWYAHRHLDLGDAQNPCWKHLAIAGAFVSGVLWGCGPFVLSPLDETDLLFMALVIGGMCAGAATVHAAHFPSVFAFIVPAVTPLAGYFFAQGNRVQVVSGIMTVIFGTSLCTASLKFRQWFHATTSARLALARQTTKLDETNARLKSEITSHRSTEAKLRQAQQQVQHQLAEAGKTQVIGQLAGGMAHDFNNVLGIVLGNLELLQEYTAGNSAAEELRTDAMSGVLHGAELTRRLLAFARRQPLHPRILTSIHWCVPLRGCWSGC
jgi:hypothetical protein